jgi:hypothetical protein
MNRQFSRRSSTAPLPPPTNFGGQKSLFRHPTGTGKCPEAISINVVALTAVSIDFTAISINVAVSYDEEGVVLPEAEGSTGSYVVHLSLS